MSRPNLIKFTVNSDHPNILAGLDSLLALGLVNDEFVRHIGQSHFSSALPETKVLSETVVAIPKPKKPKVVTPKIPAVPTIWQRFLDELSVRWLLFLGVFLVVLSSGVLVASQWENFPVVGQYLVLWSYTVIFGFVGFWAGGEKELKLTAQTLQAVAILLVPLNFWAVDEFNIWKSVPQSAVAIAAIFSLLWGVGIFAKGKDWSKPIFSGFFALSLCHWGWDNVFNPVIGVYLGIGVVIVILWGLPLLAKRSRPQKVPENIGLEFVLFGLGLLLFRAIAIEQIPVGQLGLGLGLLGWLLTELEWDRMARLNPPQSNEAIAHPWETGGAILMLWGWLVTIGRYEWQVIGVSGLAAIWLAQRLRRTWQVADLVALFFVGLQGGILIRNVIPTGFKASVTTAAVEFSQAQDFPYSVYSVTLLPYLLIWAIAAIWFYRAGKKDLARASEYLLLGLGVILAGLSLPNATWRFLNFSIAAGIGFYFTHYSRPYIRRNYLYLCHGMGLLVIGSVVERLFPALNGWMWGSLCLIALVAETLFCILPTKNAARKLWQRSSWHYAIALAVGSWILYIAYLPDMYAPMMRSPWIIAPCCATLVALKKQKIWRQTAVSLSTLGLLLLPCGGMFAVAMESPPVAGGQSFVQLVVAIAAVVMWANVRLLPSLTMVHWHITAITGLIISLLISQVTDWQWLIVGSLGSGLFWGSAKVLQQRQQRHFLLPLYRRACHQWGLVCAGLAALFLTQHYVHLWESFAYATHEFQSERLIGSVLLLAVTVIYYWRNPNNEAFIIGGIAIETCLTTTMTLQDENGLAIASGNLALAALFWVMKRTIPRLQNISFWQSYPLIFTILGFSWRFYSFNAFTGLWMFIAGCLIFAISSDYNNRFLRFLGFASITWGVYETVIYQMSQSTGNNIGNALTVFAFIGIVLALIYRSLVWFQTSRGQEKFATIPLKEILIAGHLHWAIAAGFKLLTLPYLLPEPPSFRILAIAINIFLAFYAFIQANNQTQDTTSKWSDWWIYVGALELVTTGIQARWMWTQLETIDPFRVLLVSLLALMIFQLPWTNMGWQQAPWHRVGVAMPALCIAMTASSDVSYLSLLSISCVYLRIAQIQKNVRWGYLSLIFGNWLIGKVLFAFNLIQPLSYALQIGLSILLIAQIDPDFADRKKRKLRHYLRLLGSSIICVIALINYQQFGITPAVISFAFIFLGLGLQIRAFLYNGTVTLILTGIYQLIILIDTYSFSKWVVGLVAGIILISVAANFEKRRLQIMTVLKHWVQELEQWQ